MSTKKTYDTCNCKINNKKWARGQNILSVENV